MFEFSSVLSVSWKASPKESAPVVESSFST